MTKIKVKKDCLNCFYWTGKGGIGKAYKCYCGDCPAKARDEKRKSKIKKVSKKPKEVVYKCDLCGTVISKSEQENHGGNCVSCWNARTAPTYYYDWPN